VHGDPSRILTQLTDGKRGCATGLAFAESKQWFEGMAEIELGAILVNAPFETSHTQIVVENPRHTFFAILAELEPGHPVAVGIHPSAVVDPGATVACTARVGAYAVIESGATLSEGTVVYPHAYIGPDCHLGAGAVVFPQAVLVRNVTLGAGTIIYPGAVIGSPGFGYARAGDHVRSVPQVGNVHLGEFVEIGANTTVDRATIGATSIGDHSKLDNLVQVGHNVRIGSSVLIASQVGVSGSCTLGDRVTIGGQAGFADHVSIGSDIILGGRTGVTNDLRESGVYLGFPARKAYDERRLMAARDRLLDLVKKLRRLEHEIELLKTSTEQES
jgi:UDP-3-O-[3-hydroxymyristoyl] glucosamine N-acyltransferase